MGMSSRLPERVVEVSVEAWGIFDWGIVVGKYMGLRSLVLRGLDNSSVVQWENVTDGNG